MIKIATNSIHLPTHARQHGRQCRPIADGEATVQQVGREIFDLSLRVASGEQTCAERLGHKEFVPWRIGPVM